MVGMNFHCHLRSGTALALVALVLAAVPSTEAEAARLHVAPGGLRSSGASTPGDWSPAECYGGIAGAALAAAPADTILLDRADHALATAVTLPRALLNRDLDADTTGCRVICAPSGTMTVAAGAGTFTAAGFVLLGDGQPSDVPAFTIEAGTVTSAVLRDLVFRGLRGSSLGGRGGSCLALAGNGAGTPVDLVDCLFEHNSTRGNGGALWVADGWQLGIEGCDFRDNTSLDAGRGGALMVNSPLVPTFVAVRDTRFLRNAAQGPGGAISMDDAGLDMQDSEVSASISALDLATTWSAGAGVFMRRNLTHTDSLRLDLRRCLVSGNVGLIDLDPWAGDGGGVMLKGNTDRFYGVTVEDCEFSDNFAAQGAGLYIGRYAVGEVVRCRFLRNTAYLQGGATFKGGSSPLNRGETATYRYCEFIGNRAGLDRQGNESPLLGNGGAFSTRARTRGVFINCSFLDNEAHGPVHNGGAVHKPREGDVLRVDSMRLVLVNCAFWAEDPRAQIYGDENGFSEVSNCAMRPGDFVCVGVTPVGTVELGATPYLGPADALPLPGSPLTDAGVPQPPALDLAGNPAPLGAVTDIGAYESLVGIAGVDLPPATAMLSAHPNPFNPAVTLSFALPEAGEASVTIHDLAGRTVATLLAPTVLPAGTHTLTWRGRDQAGRAVASGTYLAILQGPRTAARTKLLLLR